MRRRDIQLLSAARQGNVAARCEVGRRYLAGSDGFPRHVRIGIEYLAHSSVKGLPEVSKTIAEGLPLEDLIAFEQEEALEAAASLGNSTAQLKLGVWRIVREPDTGEGLRLLKAAAEQGNRGASEALAIFKKTLNGRGLAKLLIAASRGANLDGSQVAMLAAQQAIDQRDLPAFGRCLDASLCLSPAPTENMADLASIQVAEQLGEDLKVLSAASVQACLEMRCGHGNYSAAFTLGRALCGIPCGAVASSSLVESTNLRKGAALLLRAADSGCADAWLHLSRIHSDPSPLPHPQMARFFLEKAAGTGNVEAQRKLGASILRESNSIRESEEGMNWLFKASRSGDKSAKELLGSFVLPLEGSDAEANTAIDEVTHQAPWLASG